MSKVEVMVICSVHGCDCLSPSVRVRSIPVVDLGMAVELRRCLDCKPTTGAYADHDLGRVRSGVQALGYCYEIRARHLISSHLNHTCSYPMRLRILVMSPGRTSRSDPRHLPLRSVPYRVEIKTEAYRAIPFHSVHDAPPPPPRQLRFKA